MARAAPAQPVAGIARGDRCLYLGIGQLAGKQCDVLSAHRAFAVIRFDTGLALLTLATDLHPVPRRPPPMF
ncbi:hypothetical protein KZ810_14975 [Sphingomonas sp. RHCKR47]|uniref:hypothetical protein n=1 Tax=Sphingomonas citricola TaxID=2862498 RepID=UPI001CA5DE8B|nr:hypothetical protein [Sphingomonas citricola]MBW6524802.1 hypothetical protein [Sphingomonas citricola]